MQLKFISFKLMGGSEDCKADPGRDSLSASNFVTLFFTKDPSLIYFYALKYNRLASQSFLMSNLKD